MVILAFIVFSIYYWSSLTVTLVCHKSDDLFKAYMDLGNSIIIELLHNFFWEISQIFCFDKARPRI